MIAQLGEVSNTADSYLRIFINNFHSARLKPTSDTVNLEVAGSIPARPISFLIPCLGVGGISGFLLLIGIVWWGVEWDLGSSENRIKSKLGLLNCVEIFIFLV